MFGTLLNTASSRVEEHLKHTLHKQYVVLSQVFICFMTIKTNQVVIRSDGWKDDSKNPITGVNISWQSFGRWHRVSTKAECALLNIVQSPA
jgi:hypothetical protein